MIYVFFILCLVTAMVFHWAVFAIIILVLFFLALLSVAWEGKPRAARRYKAPPAGPRRRRR